jgi:hypothetical protein
MTGDAPETGGFGVTLPGGRGRWLAAIAAGVALLILIVALGSRGGPSRDRKAAGVDRAAGPSTQAGAVPQPSGKAKRSGKPSPLPPGGSSPTAAEAAVAADCPPATVTVNDSGSLKAALAGATPGTSIRMADGIYEGRFVATVPGAADRPIFLCGGAGAVIDAGGPNGGYGFHLDGVSYWRLVGFAVRNAQKGVMADRAQHVVVQGLTVEQIGDEAIHLRDFSTDNVVQENTVRQTGLRRDKFGEGIYIGSAKSNWCTITNCQPDLSDRNVVRGNHISGTTAEQVDIKEGTTGGVLSGNTFDGSAMKVDSADSWVDVKGNGWLIEGNVGRNTPADGFQTHEVVAGWGAGNTFRSNTAEVNGPGWGFKFAPANGNVLGCDNKAVGAASGLGNVTCT